MQLVEIIGFHEYFEENAGAELDLLKKMEVLNDEGSISEEEWEAIGLYQIAIFKKQGIPGPETFDKNSKLKRKQPPNLNETDIIYVPDFTSQAPLIQ
jgi:hypothetical protein